LESFSSILLILQTRRKNKAKGTDEKNVEESERETESEGSLKLSNESLASAFEHNFLEGEKNLDLLWKIQSYLEGTLIDNPIVDPWSKQMQKTVLLSLLSLFPSFVDIFPFVDF